MARSWGGVRWVEFVGAAVTIACSIACSSSSTSTGSGGDGGSQTGETIVTVDVFSGRPQPAAEEWSIRVGSPVTVRLVGLGPPRATIVSPDGKPVATVDAPFRDDGRVVGTEERFVPSVAGVYLVEQAEGKGLILARLNAQ